MRSEAPAEQDLGIADRVGVCSLSGICRSACRVPEIKAAHANRAARARLRPFLPQHPAMRTKRLPLRVRLDATVGGRTASVPPTVCAVGPNSSRAAARRSRGDSGGGRSSCRRPPLAGRGPPAVARPTPTSACGRSRDRGHGARRNLTSSPASRATASANATMSPARVSTAASLCDLRDRATRVAGDDRAACLGLDDHAPELLDPRLRRPARDEQPRGRAVRRSELRGRLPRDEFEAVRDAERRRKLSGRRLFRAAADDDEPGRPSVDAVARGRGLRR